MKNLMILLLVFVGAQAALDEKFVETLMAKMQLLGQQCADEIEPSSDDIFELIQKKDPSTHAGKCMVLCMQKKFNMMKEDGAIDKVGSILALDMFREADPEFYKNMLSVFVACGENAKIYDDPCETGAQLAKCCKEKVQAMGIDDTFFG